MIQGRRHKQHGSHRAHDRRESAFTLIEVLVVVAIIALLAAILLPSLKRVREQSRQMMCRNNLRSIWTGVLTYALENKDRVPFLEDPTIDDPNADPFSRDYPTAVGRVLSRYVQEGSWVCPSAVAGYPANAGRGNWKLTYQFTTSGGYGEGVPYDQHPNANSGGVLDPAISNYTHFDGRPIRLLDGRRYLSSGGVNGTLKGTWNVRFPLIREHRVTRPGDQPWITLREYPHYGRHNARNDLGRAKDSFFSSINARPGQYRSGYFELHADGEMVDIYYTRTPNEQHFN